MRKQSFLRPLQRQVQRLRSRAGALAALLLASFASGCSAPSPAAAPEAAGSEGQGELQPAAEVAPPDPAVEPGEIAGTPGSEAPPDVRGIGAGADPEGAGEPGGAAEPLPCEVSVDAAGLSPAIATVGIVTWSSTAAEIESASIEFGLAGAALEQRAPVDLTQPGYRTLLLGMKPEREYAFRVVVQTRAGTSCASDTARLTTGPFADGVPAVERQVMDAAAVAPGFVVTTAYDDDRVFIFDRDGDPVWWAEAPSGASSARMDWEGRYVWTVRGNQAGGMGLMRRVSMDGLEIEEEVPVGDPHHDLAPLPGGRMLAIRHGVGGACSSIVEVSPDLSIRPIVEDVATIYAFGNDCHPNSILYHPRDDTFTVGDRNVNLYVKVTMAGDVVWQLGGQNPIGPQIQAAGWNVNHGHQILENGNFLFFNNNGTGGGGGRSPVIELAIDAQALTAREVFRYTPAANQSSQSLGDVQRLSNGNTLVTYSNQGILHEVDASGELVQVISTARLGYAMHRESLYGPPPK